MKFKKTDRNWRSELYESLGNIRRIERQMAEHQQFPQVVGYQEIVNCSGCDDLIFDTDQAYQNNGKWFHNDTCATVYSLERNQ